MDLYQEVWDNSEYRDSLLIAEKHAQWLWANAFAVDNLDTLENQWLSLSNIKKTQIRLEKYWEEINAVLVEYEITQWLINEIPVLYVSQLFVPNGETMVLMSFILCLTDSSGLYSTISDDVIGYIYSTEPSSNFFVSIFLLIAKTSHP